MTRREQRIAAERYIYRMRNRDKREYALRYFNYLAGFSREPEPANLSVMAAQAVRMRLHDIVYPKAMEVEA